MWNRKAHSSIEILKQGLKRYRILVWLVRNTRFRLLRYCRYPAILLYARSNVIRKLQIGSGASSPLEGWLNTDIYPYSWKVIYLDARKRFPFGDGFFLYVYSEHLIEHLTYEEGQFMLDECFRVLRPGGKIRIATPDLEAITGLTRKNKTGSQRKYIKGAIERYLPEAGVCQSSFLINAFFNSWGHQFVYDFDTLRDSLQHAGFVGIIQHSVGESDDELLREIETHGSVIGEDLNRFETVVVEAKKPASSSIPGALPGRDSLAPMAADALSLSL